MALRAETTAERQRIKRRRPGRADLPILDDDLKEYLGMSVEEEGARLDTRSARHASAVDVRPIESYYTPPSPSPMLEAV